MIYAKMKELGRYKGYSQNLDLALEFLINLNTKELVEGKTELHGEDVFINVFNYETKLHSEALFEAHKNYIDIHVLLEGEEHVFTTHVEDIEVVEAYDSSKDIMFLKGEEYNSCLIKGEYVYIGFPEDAHMPGVSTQDAPTAARKLVVKIKVN